MCGVNRVPNAAEGDASEPKAVDFFGRDPPAKLTPRDRRELNEAVTKMILASLRPYEIVNETFFGDIIETALVVGSRHGKSGSRRFNLKDDDKLISGDGVRAALDKVYDSTVEY